MRSALSAILFCAVCVAPAYAGDRDDGDDRDDHRSGWHGTYAKTHYDGVSDDLLTAGLGKTGLGNPVGPVFANPTHPTAAELRRLVIHNNYRALADMSTNGGYGVLYGPNIDLSGKDTLGEGKVAGDEYIAYADSGSGRRNVTVMLQVPASFDVANPCIVAAPSSGSRGAYGAIATTGEWALKRGCAVAYTDKGTGTGVHDLQNDTVNLIDGTRSRAAAAGKASNFTARITRRRARRVQRRDAEPLCHQTRAFAAQSGERLGPRCAHVDQVRILRAESRVRLGAAPPRIPAREHDRDRVERFQRRRRLARRCGAG